MQLVCYLVKIKLNRPPLVEQIKRDDKWTVWFLSLWARECSALSSLPLTTSFHKLLTSTYILVMERVGQTYQSLMRTSAYNEKCIIEWPQTEPGSKTLSVDVLSLA